jgi:hypothetical protein
MSHPDIPEDEQIDTFNDSTLYDVLEGNLEPPTIEDGRPVGGDGYEYMGIHIVPQTEDKYHLQLDGHAGILESFNPDDFETVIGLVDFLNSVHIRIVELRRQGTEELVDEAGKIIVDDYDDLSLDNSLLVEAPPEGYA